MAHDFCFSEHTYRPIWEEGAALERIHTDVFCAGAPYHDPVTAGKEAAALWLLTQHQPTFLVLPHRICIKTSVSGRKYRALLLPCI